MKSMMMVGILGCILVVGVLGCKDDKRAGNNEDKDAYLRTQLIGTWDRECEYNGPVIYETVFNADGTLIKREYRGGAGGSLPTGSMSRIHQLLKVELPLYQENFGTWEVHGGEVYYRLKLSAGDPMRMRSKAERVSATEFVESSEGVDSKVEAAYTRFKIGQAPRPLPTTTTRR